MPWGNYLYGHRYYFPIYEVAQELGLTIVSHPLSADDFYGTPSRAGGHANSWAERYILLGEFAMSHLASLIFEGVFERFPRLRFTFLEYAWTWLPHMLWRMDATWKAARRDHPWMRKSPTEYVLESVRFGSEPTLETPKEHLNTMIELCHAETTLVFASDYPHWDSEEPRLVFGHVDDELKRRIFRDNAKEFFGPRLRVAAPVA
jgi:predicted TIM-barrel fold metal-dependent hydrolase